VSQFPQDPWIPRIATGIGFICGAGLIWMLLEVLFFVTL
jgi:hypothetical protein